MNKQEFLSQLEGRLSGLPKEDISERLLFYSEMIDDRIEEGLSEEEAISEVGSIDEIVSETVSNTPLSKIVKENVKPKRALRGWEIALIIAGSPIWGSLLIAFSAVILALYITLWALIVALWAVEISFIASALACAAIGTVFIIRGEPITGALAVGSGLVMAGLSIFLFFGCIAASKGVVKLTKKIALGIKSIFVGKEKQNG